mgnify:CR=1 FL=1
MNLGKGILESYMLRFSPFYLPTWEQQSEINLTKKIKKNIVANLAFFKIPVFNDTIGYLE